METIDLALTKEELEFIQHCIGFWIGLDKSPSIAFNLLKLIRYKLKFLKELEDLEKNGQKWP